MKNKRKPIFPLDIQIGDRELSDTEKFIGKGFTILVVMFIVYVLVKFIDFIIG